MQALCVHFRDTSQESAMGLGWRVQVSGFQDAIPQDVGPGAWELIPKICRIPASYLLLCCILHPFQT
jgi:hypothetical protein